MHPRRSFARPLPPRRRPRPWLWILILVPLCLVGAVAALLALGALFNYTGTQVELAPGERELVLDIGHLAAWMDGYVPDPAGESLTKTRYVDDSYEIEYVYDLQDDAAAPYLSYSLTFEPSEGDAKTTYFSLWGGTRIGFSMLGDVEVEIQENNELFRWGDESRLAILRTGDRPFGNLFVAKKGKTIVYLLVSGIYFDDPENLSGFLSPYLERLQSHAFGG